MEVVFSDLAAEDYRFWKKTNPKIQARILQLIGNIQQTPFSGIGKPEPLRHQLSGLWSRRITGEHRLVYEIKDERIIIRQCRFHY